MHTVRLRLRRIATFLLPLVALPAWAAAPNPGTAAITIAVSTVRNHQGAIICALFDTAESFAKRVPLARVVAHAKTPSTTCVLRNVKAGIYAVTAIHDENDNGRLDKSFFGRPTEGYGVSNNHTYAMHGPRFSENTFSLAASRSLSIAIQLRYP